MITKKVPLLYLFFPMLLGGIIAFFILENNYNLFANNTNLPNDKENAIDGRKNLKTVRLNDYHYTKPILYAEETTESPRYSSLKIGINNLVEKYKIDGSLNSASVYIRDFNNGEWMELNPQESYQPGSLLKVPILITFLKMNEKDPNTLDSYVISKKSYNDVQQNILTKSIKIGQRYKVRELLHYMIANSDNNATFLLSEYMDPQIYNKVYTDLGISIKNMDNRSLFHLSAKEYSVFFKVLFNASYLSNKDSEYAASLLSECDFKDGLIKELPKNVTVAHKFGEAGTNEMHELSESGIVYVADNPYIITVMTKGPQLNSLSSIISEISKLVYTKMAGGM